MLGAIFLASHDGSIWYFNPITGVLSRDWSNRAELVGALQTPEGDDEYLLGALAFGAMQAGLSPGPGQIFVYAPHPAIGGFGSANLMAMDFALPHEVYAQWHRSHR